jgi:hypothetical protein
LYDDARRLATGGEVENGFWVRSSSFQLRALLFSITCWVRLVRTMDKIPAGARTVWGTRCVKAILAGDKEMRCDGIGIPPPG